MANNNYFYISGFISLSLFLFFLSSFAFLLFNVSKQDSYALHKDNYVSVSIELPKVKNSASKSIKKVAVTEVATTKELSENVDVNDLFSNVWTKKVRKKKAKPVNSKRLQQIQKKIKTVEKKSVQSLSEQAEKLEDMHSNSEDMKSSSGSEVNEYFAKIQAIVYQHFIVPPNTEGESAKCVIELNALGKMIDFRILTYSSNEALNEEVDKIKERLRSVIFPVNPNKTSTRTTIILISKE